MRKITLFILSLLYLGFGLQKTNAQDEKPFQKTFKMEGRIMYDFNFLSADAPVEGAESYNFAGNEFRRVRLAAKGKVAKNIGYKAEFDFAGGKLGFRDVFLKFNLPSSLGAVKVGSFTEPSSFDNMTSSKYITFFERSMMSNTQPFKYNAGFMYDNQKLLDGKMGLQMSYTFNGEKGIAYFDDSLTEGANFVARLTGVAYQDKETNKVVHLGVNFENRDNSNEEYKYSYRMENHMGIKEGGVNFEDVKNASDIGFELATTIGSLSIQAEFETASVNLNEHDGDPTDTEYKYTSTGYYAFISYFVTGEHRPYKKSTFGRVKPKNNFCIKDGGYGALELVARYSAMDYNDYPGLDTDKNYSLANVTAGFNWYLNNNTRIMYNYTNGVFNDFESYGKDNALTGHLIRFQVDF